MPLPSYRDETARQRSAAGASPRRNVREQCERDEQGWDALAVRREPIDAARITAASDRLLADASENPDRGFATAVRGVVGR